MKEGEVCPNEVQSDRNRVPKAVRWSKVRSSRWERPSWFPNGARLATVRAEFESHLGNVSLKLLEPADLHRDVEAYDLAKHHLAAGQEELIPSGIVNQLLGGENPLNGDDCAETEFTTAP